MEENILVRITLEWFGAGHTKALPIGASFRVELSFFQIVKIVLIGGNFDGFQILFIPNSAAKVFQKPRNADYKEHPDVRIVLMASLNHWLRVVYRFRFFPLRNSGFCLLFPLLSNQDSKRKLVSPYDKGWIFAVALVVKTFNLGFRYFGRLSTIKLNNVFSFAKYLVNNF